MLRSLSLHFFAPVNVVCCVAENLGESESLLRAVKSSAHIAIRMHNWKWSEVDPFPPLQQVLASPLWNLPEYEGVREKLKSPVPDPTLSTSEGGFLTVDITHPAAKVHEPSPTQEGSKCVLRQMFIC